MSGRKKLTIKLMHEIASERGGRCLSKTYTDTRTKLKWQCAEGHIWDAIPHHVKNGSWCPVCGIDTMKSKQRGSLDECMKVIREKGGVCLTKKYINCKTKIRVRCSREHEWEVEPIKITAQGRWCPYCSHNAPVDLFEFQELARGRGGKCLSTEYANTKTKLLWECAEGHRWEASPTNVRKGSWCPQCSNHISEELCRIAFETIFEHDFPKARPRWLRNEDGNLMELDGYCKALRIAFEHQGEQHFLKVGFFQSSMPLKKRKAYDLLKKKLCKKHDVRLIEILQIGKHTALDNLSQVIVEKCRESGIQLPDAVGITIPYKKAYTSHTRRMKLALDEIVTAKGGKLLRGKYFDNFSEFEIKGVCGHQWRAKAKDILRDRWCPECAREKVNNSRKLDIGHFQMIAKERGGRCLSKEYTNTKTKLLWECAEGHQWGALPTNLKKGSWCPTCSRKSRSKRYS